jgi:hypothetical protein
MATTQDLIQQYFRSKTKQLLAAAQEAICEHPGLRGSHREEVLRLYLAELLPHRFSAGHGMVYGIAHRSQESDIVLWDSQNYPSLPMRGHNFFFAESVRAILEVKTEWNTANWNDVLQKCETASRIYTLSRSSIWDDITSLNIQIESMKRGEESNGFIKSEHRISTNAIFFFGGSSFTADLFTQEALEQADDNWPDIILLLDVGRVIVKRYEQLEGSTFGGHGIIEFIEAGEDALAVFTAAFLGILSDRSVQVEEPLYLAQYLSDLIQSLPSQEIGFPVFRPLPGREAIW